MMKNLKIPRYIQWITLSGFIFLLIMTALRCITVLLFTTSSDKKTALTDAYILGFRYDLRMVAIVMLLLFLVGSFNALNPINKKLGRKIALGIWLFFILVFALFYAVDFGNYAYLHSRVNASVINYLYDAKISFGMMWQTYHLGWNTLALIAFVVLMFWLVKRSYNFILSKPNHDTTRSKWAWGILYFFVTAYSIVGRIVVKGGQYPLRWSDAFSLGSDYAANIALNPFQSFFSTIDFRASTYDANKVRHYYNWMSDYLGVPKEARDSNQFNFSRTVIAQSHTTTKAPIENVVLVICESFSAYKSSMVGNPLNTTPFFQSMCKEGVYFNRAFTPAYGTARGVWATLTGIPDVNIGKTSSRNPAAVDQHIIMNDFANKEKYYFLGGSTSWANIRGLLTNNIQNLHLYEQGSYQSKEIDVWGISDKNLFLEANTTLSKEQKPFFAIIQTADNHRPYTIPAEDIGSFKKNDVPKDSLKKYGFESLDEYNAFRYTDFCYQTFIEAARKEKYFDKTLFVFIGDHGIRGDAGNMLPKAFTSQGLTNMHVPLLFYAPKLLPSAEYSIPASQIDVLPSIAYLCNIGYTNTTLGRNLFEVVQQPDNHIFWYDDFAKMIGTVNSHYFYNYQLNNSKANNFVSMQHNNPITNDSAQRQMEFITHAFYETSRYLLLNNKKKTK